MDPQDSLRKDPADAVSFQAPQTGTPEIGREQLPAVEIGGKDGITCELTHDGREYLMKVSNIPCEDRARWGKMSRKTEFYDLKTAQVEQARSIFSQMTERLKLFVQQGGSLVGYFRENFVDELKDCAAEILSA